MEKPNRTSDIPCFTIPALMEISHLEPTSIPNFNQQLIARCDSEMDFFRFPCRIDAIIISLCTSGECTAVSNLREYTLTEGSMFICGPKNILQVKSARNFHSDVLVVSPSQLKETHINLKNMMPLFIEFGDHPCLPLAGADVQALHNLIAQIECEIQTPEETPFTLEVINGLIAASIAKIGDILVRSMREHASVGGQKQDRAEEYFKGFTHLLGEHFKRERSVGFYAEQMCISPKYLTTQIKRISGKSVSEWIDDYVILEAKTLLKYSDLSIQEVAYELNFPNQSFFGSFFKRITGLSPSQYKAQ